ncbi:right-handed parallel beta-helix repeat-containing protein [Hymenobacter aerophilus]|uniref:right-handed parallel beta-helix repeat-containing protein n=1 Tax=Hymenobacter aerophilus TaxID=119644 RepID=UPI0003A28DC0|nr:right-handed parallel beta-helix repeat-containing protein [Hymenobacter aerophilus]
MTKHLLHSFGRLLLWVGLLTGPLCVDGSPLLSARNPHSAPASPSSYTSLTRDAIGTFPIWVNDTRGEANVTPAYALPLAPFATTDLSTELISPAKAPQGKLVYFTSKVTNNGTAEQSGIVTTITLPKNLKGVSLSNSGTYDATTGKATFPAFTLAGRQSQERNIAFTMPNTNIVGSATYAITGSTITDNTPGNNTGTSTTLVTQEADIEMVINGPTRVVPNQVVGYTVVATNLGPSTATGVSLRAQLPANLTGVSVSDGGSYINGVVTWPAVSTLNNGANIAYTVRFNAPSTTPTTITGSASATSTTSGGDPVADNNNSTNPRAQISTQVVSSLATLLCATPGKDGDATISTPPNTYYPGSGTVVAGTTKVTLGSIRTDGSSTTITPGDLVVLMQMQGAGISATDNDSYGDGISGDGLGSGNLIDAAFTAGQYEYVVVKSVSGSTLTLETPLVYGYKSAASSATQGQQTFQVLRIPQYKNLTLNENIVAPAWNGSTGGLIVLDVSGTLNFNGKKIDAKGLGFRGGAGQLFKGPATIAEGAYRHSNTIPTSANKGEGTAGTPRYVNSSGVLFDTRGSDGDGYPQGDRGRGAPGNAGGGGTDGNFTINDENTGGGGGGNAGRGGQGGNAWNSNKPYGGNGGADFTQATPSRLVMGGGGGAGTVNNGLGNPASGFSSSGAAGGGIVLVRANSISGAGTIDVSGADMSLLPVNDGSGGGGAGGSVVLLVNPVNNAPASLQSITVLADGGKGGSNPGSTSPHGPGGGGGGGIIFASSVLNSNTSSSPGANGTSFNGAQYGSGVGAADLGQAQTGITRADVPNLIAGCPADIKTTLTTNVTQANPGTTVTFTISTQNISPKGKATNVVRTITLVPNLPSSDLTLPTGAVYDPLTGVVTLAAIPTIEAMSAVTTASISFIMPSQTVLGTARSTSDTDDPATGNNDGTADDAKVKVIPLTQISGTVFDDVNYGGGSGRTLATARNSAAAISQIGSAGTTVELYSVTTGKLIQTTTTGSDGTYSFSNVPSEARYTVRVVSSTVKSARKADAVGVLPVQTFRVAEGIADPNRVGGENPTLVDAGAAATGATLASLTAGGATAQSIAQTSELTGSSYSGVDFGFNFDVISNTNDAGQGSLRQFIINSNELTNDGLDQDAFNGTVATGTTASDPAAGIEISIFMLSDGRALPGLRSGLADVGSTFTLASALPSISAIGTALDGNKQANLTGNKVAAVAEITTGPEVTIDFNGARGLLVTGKNALIASIGFNGAVGNANLGSAVSLSGSANSTVTNITATDNAFGGIQLKNADNVIVTDNVLLGGTGQKQNADGIQILSGTANASITGNTISNFLNNGIEFSSGTNKDNTVAKNIIRNNGQGNAKVDAGISIAASTNNNTFSQNTITGNKGDGIVALAGSSGNVFTQNSFSDNEDLGIDLSASTTAGGDGFSLNTDGKTAASGANGLLNFPVIYRASTFDGNLEVTGYAPAGSTLEFFIADKTAPAFGQGQIYLFTVTEGTTTGIVDGTSRTGSYSGMVNGLDQGSETGAPIFLFNLPISTIINNLSPTQQAALQAALANGDLYLTATATVTNNTTSEFSGNVKVLSQVPPLPVTLISFTAQAAGGDTRISWKTAQEVNNDYFAVERSFDGQRFEEVGRQAGQGTSAQAHTYNLTDAGIGRRTVGQLVYYRLRQVDLDGTASYSQVQTVRFGNLAAVAVWPTPTSGNSVLQLSSLPAGTYQVQVYDAAGRLLYSTTAPGGQLLHLASAEWPRGSYMVRVTGNTSTHVTRLVKN